MNDDTTDGEHPASGSPRKRNVAVAVAVGVAGLVAGGLAAGTLSAASADTGDLGEGSGYGVQRDGYGGRPAPGEAPDGRQGEDCPDDADRGPGGGDPGEQGRPSAPPSEQDTPSAAEDSSFLKS